MLDEIREINNWGYLGGITMNPTMVAKFRGDYVANLQTICTEVTCPVFAQVVSTTSAEIVEEAKRLASLGDHVVVKIHTSNEGLKAITTLKSSTDINVCATSVHSVIEAINVAAAGADHVAVFLGLLGEVDEHSTTELIKDIKAVYSHANDVHTKIMAACRSLRQIVESFKAGADEMTAAYVLWKQFLNNPFTKDRWNAFANDWAKSYGKRNWITG